MKIICMDCQTESYSDLEELKTNRQLFCARCAGEMRSQPENITAIEPFQAPEMSAGFQTASADPDPFLGHEASPVEEGIADEDILELNGADYVEVESDSAKVSDVILFPGCTLTPAPEAVESVAAPVHAEAQVAANPVQEVAPGPAPQSENAPAGTQALQQGAPAVEQPAAPYDAPQSEVDLSGRVRLINFSTLTITALAGAFVLFIVLAELLTAPSRVAAKPAENPVQQPAAVPSAPQVQPAKPAAAPTPEAAAAIPAPTATPEIKPAATPAPAPAVEQSVEKGKALFTVQVGSHKEEEAANKQAEKLRGAGFEPRVVSAEIPGKGTWYRVQAGNFSARDEANRFGAQIVAKGAAESFVISAQ